MLDTILCMIDSQSLKTQARIGWKFAWAGGLSFLIFNKNVDQNCYVNFSFGCLAWRLQTFQPGGGAPLTWVFVMLTISTSISKFFWYTIQWNCLFRIGVEHLEADFVGDTSVDRNLMELWWAHLTLGLPMGSFLTPEGVWVYAVWRVMLWFK